MTKRTILAEAIKNKGYTRKWLAEECHVSVNYLGRVIRGEVKPSYSLLTMLCDILDLYIVEVEQEPVDEMKYLQ